MAGSAAKAQDGIPHPHEGITFDLFFLPTPWSRDHGGAAAVTWRPRCKGQLLVARGDAGVVQAPVVFVDGAEKPLGLMQPAGRHGGGKV